MGSTGISTSTITIPTTGWGNDSTARYPRYCDIAVSGLTANDVVRVYLPAAAQSAAIACGLCPVCETLAGKVRLRAAIPPTSAISAQIRVEKAA